MQQAARIDGQHDRRVRAFRPERCSGASACLGAAAGEDQRPRCRGWRARAASAIAVRLGAGGTGSIGAATSMPAGMAITSSGISICTGPGRPTRTGRRRGPAPPAARRRRSMRCGQQRHLLHHAALVGQLVQIAEALAERGGGVDAGDHQHRHGIGARLRHRGDRVGEAGPGDDEARRPACREARA